MCLYVIPMWLNYLTTQYRYDSFMNEKRGKKNHQKKRIERRKVNLLAPFYHPFFST